MAFRSTVAVPGGSAPGPGAGNDPAGVARNGKLLRIIFETATDPANPATINRQLLEATILVNNWVEVRELNLQQFIGPSTGSCTGLTTDLNILYTTDHEVMRNWNLSITTAASVTVPALPDGVGPRGGFGNLIALPLQSEPRKRGNSVFVDVQCEPYADQWAFLSNVQRLATTSVEQIVRDASQCGRIVGVRLVCEDDAGDEPWNASPSRMGKIAIAGPLPKCPG